MQEKSVPCANVALAEDDGYDLGDEYAFIASIGNEPTLLDKALSGPHAAEWQVALKKEISCLEGAHTWELIHPPEGVSIIPCNKVFKEKTDPDGKIIECHYWIVAGGHKQKKGIDYDKTFSSAAKMPTVQVMLADATQHDLKIHQIDIKSAYLNAPLEEVVYMHPPKRYLKPGQEGMVCQLLKCLYGLKQAGRGWYKRWLVHSIRLGFPNRAWTIHCLSGTQGLRRQLSLLQQMTWLLQAAHQIWSRDSRPKSASSSI